MLFGIRFISCIWDNCRNICRILRSSQVGIQGRFLKPKNAIVKYTFKIILKIEILRWNLPGMMNLSFFQESKTVTSKVRRWMADEE